MDRSNSISIARGSSASQQAFTRRSLIAPVQPFSTAPFINQFLSLHADGHMSTAMALSGTCKPHTTQLPSR